MPPALVSEAPLPLAACEGVAATASSPEEKDPLQLLLPLSDLQQDADSETEAKKGD